MKISTRQKTQHLRTSALVWFITSARYSACFTKESKMVCVDSDERASGSTLGSPFAIALILAVTAFTRA